MAKMSFVACLHRHSDEPDKVAMSTRDNEISGLRSDIDLCVRNHELEKAVKLQGRLLGLQLRIRNNRKPALNNRVRVSDVSNAPLRAGRENKAKS